MNSLVQECLQSIEALDVNSYEKEMSVCEAFIETYDRAMQVLEYYGGDDLSPLQLFASAPVQQIIIEADATITGGNAPDANPPAAEQPQQQTVTSPLLDNSSKQSNQTATTTNITAAKTPVSSNETKEASSNDSKKSKEDLWEFEFRHNKSGSKEKEHILLSILLVVPRFIQAIGKLIWRGIKRIFTGKEAVKKNEQIVSAEINAATKEQSNAGVSPEDVKDAAMKLAISLYHNPDGSDMTEEQLREAQKQDVIKTNVQMAATTVDGKKYPFILGLRDPNNTTADNIQANAQGTNNAGVILIYPTFDATKFVGLLKEYHATCVNKLATVFDTLINSVNDEGSSKNFDTLNNFFTEKFSGIDNIINNSKSLRALQEQSGKGNVTIPDTNISTASYGLSIEGFYLCGDQLAKITELILKASEQVNQKLESLKAAKKKEQGFSKDTIQKAKVLINNFKAFNEKMSQLSNAYMQLGVAVERQSSLLARASKSVREGGANLIASLKQSVQNKVQQVKDNRAEKRKIVNAQREAAQATIDKYQRRTPAGKSSIGLSDADYNNLKQQPGNRDLKELEKAGKGVKSYDKDNPLGFTPTRGYENYQMPALESQSTEIPDNESVFNEQTEAYFQSDNIKGVAY